MTVSTGFTYVESVKAWIDWNNDAVLDPVNELVFSDSAQMTNHGGFVSVPGTAVLGQPLRFRVASDYSGNPTPTRVWTSSTVRSKTTPYSSCSTTV